MELFGTKGSMLAQNRHQLILRMSQGYDGFREQLYPLKEREAPFDDPFAWFAAVVRENIKPEAYDLSSLENNMVVMEILEAARQSAKSGKTIKLQ
jgi:predicted dehydrogenase